MNLTIIKFVCARHGHSFLAPDLSPFYYGEFLLRSKNNEIRHLYAIEDDAFAEVKALTQSALENIDVDRKQLSAALHSIFGEVACDRDAAGDSFQMNVFPPCPQCGTNEMASWDAAEPPRSVEVEIPRVTHHHWDSLDDAAKYRSVEAALRLWKEHVRNE